MLSQEASVFKPESVDRWMDNRVRHSAGTRYEYDRWGNRIEAKHLDGKRQKYSYDGLHKLTQVQCFEGGELISATRHRYDAFGRRLAKIAQLAPTTTIRATSRAAFTVTLPVLGWDTMALIEIRHRLW